MDERDETDDADVSDVDVDDADVDDAGMDYTGDAAAPTALNLAASDADPSVAAAAHLAVAQGALAHLLDQGRREATANRAQARELIKALEGVQRSQEYLGTELRDERRRGRWLLAALAVAPVLCGGVVWAVWARVDDLRAAAARETAELRASLASAAAAHAESISRLRDESTARDLDGVRSELDATRQTLTDERRIAAEREKALLASIEREEASRRRVDLVEYEARAAHAKARAESARAAALEDELTAAQRREAAAVTAPAAPASPWPSPSRDAATPRAAPDGGAAPERSDAPQATPAPTGTPVTDPAALGAVRERLNELLAKSGGSVRYDVDALGGLDGRTLLDVRVVGRSEGGAVLRTIEAKSASIAVDRAAGAVVVRFHDGRLVLGGRSAPFFDGSYGLVLDADAAAWRASGLVSGE